MGELKKGEITSIEAISNFPFIFMKKSYCVNYRFTNEKSDTKLGNSIIKDLTFINAKKTGDSVDILTYEKYSSIIDPLIKMNHNWDKE